MVFSKPKTLKVLALDFGGRKIGVAIGDSTIGVANSRKYLINDENVVGSLKKICTQEKVKKILIGLPKGFRGETQQGRSTKTFAEEIRSGLSIDIEFIDERFTTKIATQRFKEIKTAKEQKELVDSESARILLEEYFDRD